MGLGEEVPPRSSTAICEWPIDALRCSSSGSQSRLLLSLLVLPSLCRGLKRRKKKGKEKSHHPCLRGSSPEKSLFIWTPITRKDTVSSHRRTCTRFPASSRSLLVRLAARPLARQDNLQRERKGRPECRSSLFFASGNWSSRTNRRAAKVNSKTSFLFFCRHERQAQEMAVALLFPPTTGLRQPSVLLL